MIRKTKSYSIDYSMDQLNLIKLPTKNQQKAKQKLKAKLKKRVNHLSKPEKLNTLAFDLSLDASGCKTFCNYAKEEICYVENNPNERYKSRKNLLARNIDFLYSDNFVNELTNEIKRKHLSIFRFFSSGDFPDLEAMCKIMKVCENLKNTVFWVPTSRQDILKAYFEDLGLKKPKNVIIRLSCPDVGLGVPDFILKFCKKHKINYSMTTLNSDLVNCHCSLDSSDAVCGDCDQCYTNENIVYLIHGQKARKKAIELISKRGIQND
jgi:hypothetical protein